MAQIRRIHRNDSLYPGSDKFYTPYIGKGAIIFPGPDAIRNQNVTILNPTYIGIGTMSPEGTSNVDYLWRPGRRWAYPTPKSAKVGAIGWGLHLFNDIKRLKSGNQINRGTFRQQCEDRHTHLYQNPWYPDMQSEEGIQGAIDGNRYQEETVPSCSKERCLSRQRAASPSLYRSQTPSPRTVHYGSYQRRAKSCTPPDSQRVRSGTMSSTATTVQSQLYAL